MLDTSSLHGFMCESEVFNGPVCKVQCKRCKPKPRKPHPNEVFADYEIRTGKDGKVGIYLRAYNMRLATFNANTHHAQTAFRALFERAFRSKETRAHARRKVS